MKRKVKLLTCIIFLLSLIFLLLIIHNDPLTVSNTESFFQRIPIYHWVFLLLIPILISVTFLITESKKVCVFLAISYFFILYSYFLLFVIPPAGTDMSEGGHVYSILQSSTTLNIEQYSYFQWPIHYLFYSISIKILGVGLTVLSLVWFSFILMIPLFFSLFETKSSANKVFFLLPVVYIMLSSYLVNIQWVPQFTGLLFLILTIGCYTQLKEKQSKRYYFLTISFYTICVFTHPFIFIFFPATILLDRYIISKTIFGTPNSKQTNISTPLLIAIYFCGYIYRFVRMERVTRILVYPETERLRSWDFIYRIFGTYLPTDTVHYETFPFYRFVSRRAYLISRYSTYTFLAVIFLLMTYILVKNLRNVKSFDISLGGSGLIFFILGLVHPTILGGRAFQVIFLKFPRYFSYIFMSKRKIFVFVLTITIMIAPLLFTTNRVINQDLSGGRNIQDESTLASGRFVVEYVSSDLNVLVAEFSFYPGRGNNIYRTRSIPREDISIRDIDIIINCSKQTNRMEFYGLELDYNYTSKVYDNGNSNILIVMFEP